MAKTVGRPRSFTDSGGKAPIKQHSVPYESQGGGTVANIFNGRPAPWSQFVDEAEFVPELIWPQSIPVFDQMRTDSQLAALYTAVSYGISQLRFIIDPNHAKDEIVKGVSEDLNLPIRGQDDQPRRRMKRRFAHSRFISQALLALIYGHMYFEQVGEIVDGKWRLRKMPAIMPRTIQNINVADDGGLVSVQQFMPMGGDPAKGPPEIPVDNLVGFVYDMEGQNWVGRSMMRDCYKDWLIKDRLVRIDAINHERAGGVPYAEAPAGATPAEIEDLDAMMRSFRVGETSGGALPFGAKLNIAKGSGSRVVDSISQRDEAMARRFLLQIMNLAQSGQHVGSYALGETFNDFFLVGQRAIVQWYCDTVNELLIEDWVDWNYGEDEELCPLITWERTSEDALGVEQLATLVEKGVIIVDEELEDAIRYKYRLPHRTQPRPDPVEMQKLALEEQKLQQQGDFQDKQLKQKGAVPGQGAPSTPKSAPAPTKKAPAKKAPVKASIGGVYDWERETPEVMATADPVLMTIPDVPILEVGIEYKLSTGHTTFTPEDLRDVVTAANEDPSIPPPRLGIGHVDPRFNGPEFDGTPNLGTARNLRLSENGMAVYADYVGVPRWLGKIMPAAFPNRSIEGWWDVESMTGKKWRFVLSACKLLGVKWPGITSLEDLPLYYGEDIPQGIVVDPGIIPEGVTASANLDDIRRAFYGSYVPQIAGAKAWWIRQVMVDPNQIVCEDDESGQLFILSFKSDGQGTISFGDPEPVRVDYVLEEREAQKEAASHIAAALAVGHEVMATYESRASSRPTERGGMDPTEIRRKLDLPDDATDEQVRQALKELNTAMATPEPEPAEPLPGEEQPPAPPEGEPQPGEEQPPAEGEPQPAPAEQPVAVTASAEEDGFVKVDKATWEQVRAGAATAVSLKADQDKKRNGDEVAAAIGDGRIPPARKDHWVKLLDVDYEGNSQVLASLEPGLIPVTQRGSGQTGEDMGGLDQSVQNWTHQLFPETVSRATGDAVPMISREEG